MQYILTDAECIEDLLLNIYNKEKEQTCALGDNQGGFYDYTSDMYCHVLIAVGYYKMLVSNVKHQLPCQIPCISNILWQ